MKNKIFNGYILYVNIANVSVYPTIFKAVNLLF